jgi:hypothetical protein
MPPRKKSLQPRSRSKTDRPKPPATDGKSESPREPASRRPPAVSGRVIVSKGRAEAEDAARKRTQGKPASEVPTMPPPPPDPVRDSRANRTSEIVRKKPQRGITVDEVTANLSKDPRSEK